jgi:hypothetical protein
MDATAEIRLRLKISKLEARLELREIEIAALSREIAASLTTPDQTRKIRERLDAVQQERAILVTELASLQRLEPAIHR